MGNEIGLVFVLSMSTLPMVISNGPQIVTIALLCNEKYVSWKPFTSSEMNRDTEQNQIHRQQNQICCW